MQRTLRCILPLLLTEYDEPTNDTRVKRVSNNLFGSAYRTFWTLCTYLANKLMTKSPPLKELGISNTIHLILSLTQTCQTCCQHSYSYTCSTLQQHIAVCILSDNGDAVHTKRV